MLIEMFEMQEMMRAKKKYEANIGKISDLDDICVIIDELIGRIEDVNCEFKDKFVQSLKDMKFDIVSEMRSYEQANFEIMEVYEEESEDW